MSEVGLMPREFHRLTFYEYSLVLAGYNIRNWKQKEHTRSVCYTIYKMNTTDKKQITEQDWWPLPSDAPKPKIEIHTAVERDELVKMAQERMALLQNKL